MSLVGAGVLLWLLAGGSGQAAEGRLVRESELKAAFLPKFPLFVQWPSSSFAGAEARLVIGVLGENPFGDKLEVLVRGKVVDGHPIAVRQCRDAKEALGCHIVFCTGANATGETVRQFAGSKVLTVGDTPGFAEQGGMVNLVMVDRKVRLEVNLEAVQKAELRIDPQLLQLARVIRTATPQSKP